METIFCVLKRQSVRSYDISNAGEGNTNDLKHGGEKTRAIRTFTTKMQKYLSVSVHRLS